MKISTCAGQMAAGMCVYEREANNTVPRSVAYGEATEWLQGFLSTLSQPHTYTHANQSQSFPYENDLTRSVCVCVCTCVGSDSWVPFSHECNRENTVGQDLILLSGNWLDPSGHLVPEWYGKFFCLFVCFVMFEEVQAVGQNYPWEHLDAFDLWLCATVAGMLHN